MFVKWSCGCKGLRLQHVEDSVMCIVIDSCQRGVSDDQYCFHAGQIDRPHEFKPMPLKDSLPMIRQLGRLVDLGQRMQDLASVVNYAQQSRKTESDIWHKQEELPHRAEVLDSFAETAVYKLPTKTESTTSD